MGLLVHIPVYNGSVGIAGCRNVRMHTEVPKVHSFNVGIICLPILLHGGGVMSPQEELSNQ